MSFARNLPLRQKLTLLVTVTSGLVLTLACLVLAAYDLRQSYRELESDLGSLARVIGSNSTGALTFEDPRAAEEILAAMSARPHIVSARLYDAKGQPFASYHRAGSEADVLPEVPMPDSYRAERAHVVLFQGVKLGQETAGTLYLKADLGQVRSHFEGYLVVVLLVMLGSMVAASFISARWQRLVSDPILRLAEAAGAVASSKDYSVRVASPGGDELGVLTAAFNEMLSQIERRDAELRAEVKERQNAEDQLRQAQKMEAVGRLAGGVAHDFNNLLGVILGYSEMLLGKDLAPPHRRKVEEIQKAGVRAATLTRQLLAFSRKQVLAPKVLDLSALVVEFSRMLPRVLGEDIELVIAEGAELGQVKADPGQLEQILMNLCVNARDAMPEGGRITIATSNAVLDEERAAGRGVAAGSFVMLAVSDTGCGMDADTQSHAFEPFFTTKALGKGTGLGLATVYGIMKQSDGHIAIETAPGRGTTFRLYFPRVDEPVEVRLAAAPEPARHGTETILLVEDDGAFRALVASMLRERGHTVLEADCGATALLLSDRHPGVIDLLLSDVIMPGMNGRQVGREVTLRRPATRVVFMSGHSDEALGTRGVLDPGTILLAKPFSGAALDRCLNQVLGDPPKVVSTAPDIGRLPEIATRPQREIRPALH
jgi:signal transduction histidine kinase/ActR/RegA family two-component response regulator